MTLLVAAFPVISGYVDICGYPTLIFVVYQKNHQTVNKTARNVDTWDEQRDCLKSEREIWVKTKKPSQNMAFRCTPTLRWEGMA